MTHQTPAVEDFDADLIASLNEARHRRPHDVLGRHQTPDGYRLLVLFPGTAELRFADVGIGTDAGLQRVGDSDVFVWQGRDWPWPERWRLSRTDTRGHVHEFADPYAFAPALADYDLYLFGQGKHWHAWRWLGAHPEVVDGIAGVRFAVWAPNAVRVSVVGDFNQWDGRRHMMSCNSEVWELFIPGLAAGDLYKFEIRAQDSTVLIKADPYAQWQEFRPGTASRIREPVQHVWADAEWMQARRSWDWQREPMSIYEMHPGSWRCWPDGGWYGYRELAHQLVDYLKPLGYTHVELMPIMEYPFDGSWGYQPIGLYAPTSRYGSADDFRYFVDHLHQHGIGVLLDWVAAHFPKDAHGLARFDGQPVYEHPDPRIGEHADWGTLVFDYGRPQVKNYLMANAVYWMEEFHLDGLRVDAVSSIIHLNYSRPDGTWVPNRHGGAEYLEAIDFLRELNAVIHAEFPGAVMTAEEATAFPMVSRPAYLGGLGFSMKWNMGWMHDSLDYFKQDPYYRRYHHNLLTFGITYTWNENFVLPLSHDEVVHGKSPLLYKMPGDDWQKFANLRLLFAWLWTYPGKKLLFMGGEFAQTSEWTEAAPLRWDLLQWPLHQGIQSLVADLNAVYRREKPLHRRDFEPAGFQWIDCHDYMQSVISYLRRDGEDFVIVVLNFTPVVRHDYRIGVPLECPYRELLNTDSQHYGGSNVGNHGYVLAQPEPCHGFEASITLSLPPLGALVLKPMVEGRTRPAHGTAVPAGDAPRHIEAG